MIGCVSEPDTSVGGAIDGLPSPSGFGAVLFVSLVNFFILKHWVFSARGEG